MKSFREFAHILVLAIAAGGASLPAYATAT